VHVPKQLAVSERITALMPIALQDGLSRVSNADAVLSQADGAARAGYELRAAHSVGSLTAAPEQPQITRAAGGDQGEDRAVAQEPIRDQAPD
jgi:hypothetical protein